MMQVARDAQTVLLACCFALLGACVSQTTVENKIPDQAAPSDPAFRAKLHTERAAEYLRVGNYATALEAAQTALTHVPAYAPAYNVLGIIHMQLKQDDKAEQALAQALRLAPNDSEVLNNYGWFVCERRDPKAAMAYFERALRNPLYVSPERALHNAGHCARKSRDFGTAEASFRAALVKAPSYMPSMLELGELLIEQGRHREAAPLIGRYMEGDPQPPVNALHAAARLAKAVGDKNAEASYVQQMRRRFPDDPRTREAVEGR
jgi:type IV pilus assembly protein PilF